MCEEKYVMKNIILLLMLLTLSLFGKTEENGKPYIDMDEGRIDSAVVAPVGKRFYTLKDGMITYWQLEPLKKLFSFQTNIEKDLCSSNKSFPSIPTCNINISSDETRLIIRSKKNIALFDLERKVLLSEVEHQSAYGLWDDRTYITLEDKPNFGSGESYVHYTMWDIGEKINKLHNGSYLSTCQEWHLMPFTCHGNFKSALMIGDSVLIMSGNQFSIYDKKTFKNIKTERFYNTTTKRAFLNYESQFIDFTREESPRIYLDKKKNVFQKSEKTNRFLIPAPIRSLSRELALYKVHKSYYFVVPNQISSLKTSDIVAFHQFKDAEGAILVRKGNRLNKKYHFELTPGARDYLKMKSPTGFNSPINETTFNKYNKEIKF